MQGCQHIVAPSTEGMADGIGGGAGPPGAGKSRLARRRTTILPAMTLAEALETTRIH